MDREIYQEQYDFELNQKNYLASSVNIPIIAVTLIGSALISMLLNFSYSITPVSIIFLLASSFSALFLAISIYLIFCSLIGYEYKKIALPYALNNHYNELLEWHKNNQGSEEDAKADFNIFILQRLGEAVEINSKNNINRGNYLYMTTIAVAVSVIFLAISGGLYVFNKQTYVPEPHKVEIVGTVNTN